MPLKGASAQYTHTLMFSPLSFWCPCDATHAPIQCNAIFRYQVILLPPADRQASNHDNMITGADAHES